MYNELLIAPFSQAIKKFSEFESINSVRKVITFKNNTSINSYSTLSDTIVYYDVLSDSTPLLLVERIGRCDVKMSHMRLAVKNLNHTLKNWVATIRPSIDNKFIDIVVVKQNIYKSLKGKAVW